MYNPNLIRNICIIAHIDHGKTTLIDRILEITGSVDSHEMKEQFLDMMDIERERGITIKAQPVKVLYKASDEKTYEINIIDTPGHVDFSYEVGRSMAACEGAVLLVDASQGVEAQTVAHTYLALENDLEIIPALNKIDLSSANIEETALQVMDLLGVDENEILKVSAKEGTGIKDLLEEIVRKIPPPDGNIDDKLAAIIFDARYDKYRGVVVSVRLFSGRLEKGDRIITMSNGLEYEVDEIGVFTPFMRPVQSLSAGEVGYVIAGIKEVSMARVGDTITHKDNSIDEPLPGYKEIKPMVYAGMYPGLPEYYQELRKALEKLKLNDSALSFEPDNSPALGFGFRVGFLGLLHMDVVRERIEREFELAVILTAPNVEYKVKMKSGEIVDITNPSKFPNESDIEEVYEPWVDLSVITPGKYMGNMINLIQVEKRGKLYATENAGRDRVILRFEVPLAEIIFDFFDRMKALSRGYASMDYEFLEYRRSDLVKIVILVNREPVDALTFVAHKSKAYQVARKVVEKLKDLIPPHQFQIPVQAKAGGRIIARTDIRALRKDVLAKCYGGDVTRKMKLLEKQKEGKKKLREIGKVRIPQEAFLALLKIGEDED